MKKEVHYLDCWTIFNRSIKRHSFPRSPIFDEHCRFLTSFLIRSRNPLRTKIPS